MSQELVCGHGIEVNMDCQLFMGMWMCYVIAFIPVNPVGIETARMGIILVDNIRTQRAPYQSGCGNNEGCEMEKVERRS